jgi:cytochrome c biogenesis protein CcdA
MNVLTTVSLITAFAGGMVALFAPCCITFLLPSYLANIFHERKNVLALTVLFGLGIATILVPTALGIRAVGQVFLEYHTQTYLIGGAIMIILGLMELTGKKISIPMIHLTIDLNAHKNPWAVYLLGVFSGITSSCCTPVLAGILTLSFLSPTFLWAGLAGVAYVSGMVVPLVVLAILLDRVDWQKMMKVKGRTILLLGKPRLLTDVIAGCLFITSGLIISLLAASGQINMGTQKPVEATLGAGTMYLVRTIRNLPGSEYFFAVLLILFIIFLIRKGNKS